MYALTALAAAVAVAVAAPAAVPARTYVLAGSTRDAAAIRVAPGRAYADGFGYEADPHLFSIAATPGNYAVTVTLGDPAREIVIAALRCTLARPSHHTAVASDDRTRKEC